MNSRVLGFLEEPKLRFGYRQSARNPKDGLFLFGPLVDERKPSEMRIGVIGTPDGLASYRRWVESINGYIPAASEASHHTPFPGFEAAFKSKWPETPALEISVSREKIAGCIRIADRHLALFETVSIFSDAIRDTLRNEDYAIDVWFVVIPEEVYTLGRPFSRVSKVERVDVGGRISLRQGLRFLREPSMFVEHMEQAEVYRYEVNFHHQLKARLIESRAVVQIVRETSLATITSERQKRRLQDPATLAWNLCTATYFKSGGRPWKLNKVRDGVCYVGLVFKQDNQNPGSGNACCGAQMFLDSGDGLVFKGAVGPWYSSQNKEYHLPSAEAEKLIRTVVQAYSDAHGSPPKELFIHGRTRFSDDEWAGFKAGVPFETNLVGVRITRSQDMKLFRPGRTPVLRGTTFNLSERRALLWTMGFIPELNTYPGREVPNPLSVEISRGIATIEDVLADVLALTKVNFNACIYADGLPVTLRFADAVGEILTAAPRTDGPPLPFRHYI